MTFLGPLAEELAAGAQLDRGQLASLVHVGLANGMTPTEMLGELRDAGFGIRTQSFYQLAGEVGDAIDRAGDLATHPADQILSEDQYAIWHGGQTDTYLHRVTLIVRESEQGVISLRSIDWDVLSDVPLSQEDAVAEAERQFNEHVGEPNYAHQQSFGGLLRGAYHQLGRQ